jgi:hypothetical protein
MNARRSISGKFMTAGRLAVQANAPQIARTIPDDTLSCSEVCDWSRQFLMGREYLEGARRNGQSPDFSVQLRIQSALKEMPLVSVRCIAEATHTPVTTAFYILTEVLGLRFRH